MCRAGLLWNHSLTSALHGASNASLKKRAVRIPHAVLKRKSSGGNVSVRAGGLYFSTTDPSDQVEIKRAIDVAERAGDAWELRFTDFYTPSIVSDILANVKKLAGVTAIPWGGHDRAERCRVCMGKEELMLAAKQNLAEEGGVAAVRVKGRFAFDAASHRDFLGACLGTGIDRSKVGDIIILGEEGAQILLVPELVDHLETSLVQVRSVSVETRQIPLSELSIAEPKVDHFRTVEASLRLDSIASAGFRLSRAKMSDIVKSGDVRVNWKPAKASATVKTGDIISCAGKGRVEVGEIATTKKGRYAVDLVRYL